MVSRAEAWVERKRLVMVENRVAGRKKKDWSADGGFWDGKKREREPRIFVGAGWESIRARTRLLKARRVNWRVKLLDAQNVVVIAYSWAV